MFGCWIASQEGFSIEWWQVFKTYYIVQKPIKKCYQNKNVPRNFQFFSLKNFNLNFKNKNIDTEYFFSIFMFCILMKFYKKQKCWPSPEYIQHMSIK
jgi:hypothetical protein